MGAAIGEGILGLARQWELMNAKTQLSESTVAAADAETRFLLGLQGNDDVETYDAEFDKLLAELDILAPKNRRAAEIYNMQRANRRVSLWQTTQRMAKDKLKSKAQLADFLLLQKAKDSGDPNDVIAYKASVINNTRFGAYDTKAAETLLDSIDREVELAEKKRQILADEALEAKRELDRDMLGKGLDDGTIDYGKIDNSSLDETEQETYRRRMITELERRSKGEFIVTNQLSKGMLEDMAYKIWTGAVRKSDYDRALFNARYPTATKPTIDDGAYDELKSLGAKELKTSQAKGMQEANSYARGQLIEIENELDWKRFFDKLKEGQKERALSERKIDFENWSQFKRSMRIWLSQHPDTTESEIDTESRRKMPFYRGRADEDIISGKLPELPLPESLRKLNTKEAYRKGKELGYWE